MFYLWISESQITGHSCICPGVTAFIPNNAAFDDLSADEQEWLGSADEQVIGELVRYAVWLNHVTRPVDCEKKKQTNKHLHANMRNLFLPYQLQGCEICSLQPISFFFFFFQLWSQNLRFFFYFQPIFGILPRFYTAFSCFFCCCCCLWPLTPLQLLFMHYLLHNILEG